VNDPVDLLKDVVTRLRPARSRVLLAAVALVLVLAVAGVIWPKSGVGPEITPVPEPSTGGDVEAQFPVEQNLDVAGPVQLEFDGLNGSLNIQPGAPGKLAITAVKSARGTSQQDADDRASKVPLSIRKERDRVIFSARSDGALPWSAPTLHHVDYDIVAPEESGLTVVDGHGTIDASGLHRPVDVAGDDLAVSLTNVGGASVTVKRGGIVVDGAAGQTRLDGGTGDIQAQHLSGPSAELNADGGVSVAETAVAGRLIVTSKGTLVSLQRAGGREIDVQTGGGAIELTDVTTDGALKLDAARGKVTAERVQAHPLAVTTTTGEVDLTGVQSDVDVRTAGAPVALDEANISSLAVSSAGGDVSFSGRLPTAGATSIDTGGGKLDLAIARESAFALDADAGRGSLTVEPSLLSGINLSGSTARTSINGGGPRVVLRTHDGALSITTS
jgi:DUF4097 and DUF4098 domain-containing protein YvlB